MKSGAWDLFLLSLQGATTHVSKLSSTQLGDTHLDADRQIHLRSHSKGKGLHLWCGEDKKAASSIDGR
jgi:hypothetical protein